MSSVSDDQMSELKKWVCRPEVQIQLNFLTKTKLSWDVKHRCSLLNTWRSRTHRTAGFQLSRQDLQPLQHDESCDNSVGRGDSRNDVSCHRWMKWFVLLQELNNVNKTRGGKLLKLTLHIKTALHVHAEDVHTKVCCCRDEVHGWRVVLTSRWRQRKSLIQSAGIDRMIQHLTTAGKTYFIYPRNVSCSLVQISLLQKA